MAIIWLPKLGIRMRQSRFPHEIDRLVKIVHSGSDAVVAEQTLHILNRHLAAGDADSGESVTKTVGCDAFGAVEQTEAPLAVFLDGAQRKRTLASGVRKKIGAGLRG